jgi:hypothetical protein
LLFSVRAISIGMLLLQSLSPTLIAAFSSATKNSEFATLLRRFDADLNFNKAAGAEPLVAVPTADPWIPKLNAKGIAVVGALHTRRSLTAPRLARGTFAVFAIREPGGRIFLNIASGDGSLHAQLRPSVERLDQEVDRPAVTVTSESPEKICWWDDKIRICHVVS